MSNVLASPGNSDTLSLLLVLADYTKWNFDVIVIPILTRVQDCAKPLLSKVFCLETCFHLVVSCKTSVKKLAVNFLCDRFPPLLRTIFIPLLKNPKFFRMVCLSLSALSITLYPILFLLRIQVLPLGDHILARAGSEWRLNSLYGLSLCFGKLFS